VAPKGAELVCRAAGRAPIPCAAAAGGEHWKVAPERESGDGKWTLRSVKRKKNNCDVWVPHLIVGIE